ncbi:DNA/RNA non-specific endonuclease [uncultured Sphaerochaeta sp.]|uniref:DNA/RNA non-specific endonuclease n=1 Tax=uncultured Sphaerochaeta sp. TaxID=886478 RepID=UPI002A0A3613|nr:DNA/RNA non-specific endonuclease [uncultured Sphaerochaeta sp.]
MKKNKLKKTMDVKVAKVKKRGKKLLYLLIAILILWILTLIFAPSETEFESTSSVGTIQGLEIPRTYDGDEIINHTGYTLCYDDRNEQAKWVAYELTRDELYGTYERTDDFKADPAVQFRSASLDDYKSSGYDRGHLIPAADQSWSKEAMEDSFYLSNMSPQDPQFNRGIWSKLESAVRNIADTEGSIYVVTGPVLTDGPFKTIGKNKVAVPKYYYKVLLDYTDPQLKAIGFILPNEGSSKPLESFATTVDAVEKLTKIDFFPKLPDKQEDFLEGSVNVNDWAFGDFQASAKDRKAYTPVEEKITGKASPLYYLAKNSLTGVLVLVKNESMVIIKTIVPKDFLEKIEKAFD